MATDFDSFTLSGSASSLNADLVASTKILGYETASIQITGTWVGTINVQGSNDNSNFENIYAEPVGTPNNGVPTISITQNGIYHVPLNFQYLRVRMTAYTSGTATTSTVVYERSIGEPVGPNLSDTQDGSGYPITSDTFGTARSLNVMIGDGYQRDGWGRIRVSDTDLVESLHFSNGAHPLLILSKLTGSGTSAYNSATSSIRLTTTTSSSDTVIVQSKRYFRYNPGRSYIVTASGSLGAKKTNVQQRVGYFDVNNGLFFQQDQNNLSVVVRTNASGSPVDTVINQSSWNIDKLDGTGISGVTLDTSKHNLYIIDFLWHGAGRIRFGIINNGVMTYCHQVSGSNVASTPFMRTPSLPLRVELNNTGTVGSSTVIDLVCFAYQKEASDTLSAPYTFSTSTVATSKNVASTIVPLISIRPKATFNGNTNRVPIIPQSISVATNQQLVYVVVYLNPTLTGASFGSVDANSATEVDTAATAVTAGTIVKEFYVPASSSLSSSVSANVIASLDLLTLGLDIAGSTQDVLCVAARSTAGGSTTWAQTDWQEYQ